ncbi:hypothetical protein QR680_007333 [Steinernema hermaphroditum]|uniref:EF-hand domain-containing protein n=1 Tax=Steinernema hermaphroditum TaxID=289476 RepID=A0AA39IEG8_9BILA|nr:hypothetical protein QR680_007333 [Steinernema hermaphroditum]
MALKTILTFIPLVVVLVAKPQDPQVRFIDQLFAETDLNGDGVINHDELRPVVAGVGEEKELKIDEIMSQVKPQLNPAAFSRLIKQIASPAFNPIIGGSPDGMEDPTPEEMAFADHFRDRGQPKPVKGKGEGKGPRMGSRRLHPADLIDSYKNLRDAEHVEDLYYETDVNGDTKVQFSEALKLVRDYNLRISSAEFLKYFVRAMDEGGLIHGSAGLRVFLDYVSRACHKNVSGQMILDKTLRDRCYAQECLMENEKYRNYPLPEFHSPDEAQVRHAIELYASFIDEGNAVTPRNFDRLVRSKSFRQQLKNPIFQC